MEETRISNFLGVTLKGEFCSKTSKSISKYKKLGKDCFLWLSLLQASDYVISAHACLALIHLRFWDATV